MERAGILTKVKIKLDEVTPPGVDLPFDDFIGPILDECAREIAEVAPLHLLSPMTMVLGTTKRKIINNVATLTLSGSHPYLVGDIVTVSGIIGEPSYNGDFAITVITEDSISYALDHTGESETAETSGIVTYKTIFTSDKAYIPKPSDYLRLYEMKFPPWQKTIRETTKPDSDAGKMQDNDYLKSGIGRPTVVIKTTMPAGGTLKEYLVCAKVETAVPVPVPVALYVQIPLPETLPDQLIDSLTWLAAAKVLQVSGIIDKAQATMQQYQSSLTQLARV